MFLTGVLQSFCMAFFCGLGFITIRLVSNVYDIIPVLYTIIAFMTTAMIMTLAAGPGKYAFESLKSIYSWLYGVSMVGLYISQVFLLKYVSGTELTIFNNIAIPLSMLIAYVFFKRKQQKFDLAGMLVVCVSLYIGFRIQDRNTFLEVLFLALSVGLFNTLMTIFSETHDQSDVANREGHFRDKIRVVAFVSFISAVMFLILAVGLSYIKTYYPNSNITKHILFIPNLENFVNLPSVLLGVFMGTFIVPLNRYLKWSASYKIKTENILMILAFTPIFTLFFEWVFSHIPSFKSNLYIFEGERGAILLFVVFLSTLGAGLPIFVKVAKGLLEKRKKGDELCS